MTPELNISATFVSHEGKYHPALQQTPLGEVRYWPNITRDDPNAAIALAQAHIDIWLANISDEMEAFSWIKL